MNKTVWAAAVLALACTAAAPAANRPAVGLTLNASIGTHRESTGEQHVPLLPLPLLTVRIPSNRFELELEGLPPVTVAYDSGISLVSRNTRLSYLAGTLRYRFAHSGWTLGYGGILYNQVTTYTQMVAVPLPVCPGCSPQQTSQTQFERSRVGGARYEVGYSAPLSERRSISVMLGVTPALHATVDEDFTFRPSFAEPESASQFDSQVRFTLQARRVTWLYGIRYINYRAHFDSNGAIADQNTLVMPFVGALFPLGH